MFKKASAALVAMSLVAIAQPALAQADVAESIKAAALKGVSKVAKRGSLSTDDADCMKAALDRAVTNQQSERCVKSEDGNRYISTHVPRPNNPDHVHTDKDSKNGVATKPKKR